MTAKFKIEFPKISAHDCDQDEEYFFLVEPDRREDRNKRKILFHDYAKIYNIVGLYEQLFYERLKCNSPKKVLEALRYSISQAQENFTELRVLDLGAGNGMMGEQVRRQGVARLVGADIIPEAQEANDRDRPTVYDAYYVADFCNLTSHQKKDLEEWSFNCLTTVAALGFGDIPAKAFTEAFNILQSEGWIAFNIKETFLDKSDLTGFSVAIRELIFSEYLDVYYLERYRHRLSMEGKPLYYFAIAGRKNSDIPKDFLESIAMG
jgi:SAM-dependent methyltransferase